MEDAEDDNDMSIGDYDDDNMLFKTGDMVELHSIQKFPKFNGMVGKVTGYFEDSERYEVTLTRASKPYKFKAANLKTCENQKTAKQHHVNAKLKRSTDEMLRGIQRKNMEAEQTKLIYMLCGLFGTLILVTLWSTGAMGYVYRDSFAAPYLQMVGEPVKENVLIPVYENVLVPVYKNVLFPIYENVLQPLQAALKTLSSSIAEYVLKPLFENVIQPIGGALSPVINTVKGSVTQITDTVKGLLTSIIGSEEATSAANAAAETVAEAAGGTIVEDIIDAGVSETLVEEIEHTDL